MKFISNCKGLCGSLWLERVYHQQRQRAARTQGMPHHLLKRDCRPFRRPTIHHLLCPLSTNNCEQIFAERLTDSTEWERGEEIALSVVNAPSTCNSFGPEVGLAGYVYRYSVLHQSKSIHFHAAWHLITRKGLSPHGRNTQPCVYVTYLQAITHTQRVLKYHVGLLNFKSKHCCLPASPLDLSVIELFAYLCLGLRPAHVYVCVSVYICV